MKMKKLPIVILIALAVVALVVVGITYQSGGRTSHSTVEATSAIILDTPQTLKEFFGESRYRGLLQSAKRSQETAFHASTPNFFSPQNDCASLCIDWKYTDFEKRVCDGTNDATCTFTPKIYAASADKKIVLMTLYPQEDGATLYTFNTDTGHVHLTLETSTTGLVNSTFIALSPQRTRVAYQCDPLFHGYE